MSIVAFGAFSRISAIFVFIPTVANFGLRRMDMVERKLSIVVNPVVQILYTNSITSADGHIGFLGIFS